MYEFKDFSDLLSKLFKSYENLESLKAEYEVQNEKLFLLNKKIEANLDLLEQKIATLESLKA